MEHMEVTKRTLRQFGLMVGGVFLLIGLWPFVWRQEPVRIWAVVPGSLLAVAGLVVPSLLKQVYQGWMWVGHVHGMGQHPYYFGGPVLWRCDADGVGHEIDRP